MQMLPPLGNEIFRGATSSWVDASRVHLGLGEVAFIGRCPCIRGWPVMVLDRPVRIRYAKASSIMPA